MGQACFTTISSNRACHHGLHCSQFSVPAHAVVVRFSECLNGWGQGSLPPFSTVPGQLSPVGLWLWGANIRPRSRPCAWWTGRPACRAGGGGHWQRGTLY